MSTVSQPYGLKKDPRLLRNLGSNIGRLLQDDKQMIADKNNPLFGKKLSIFLGWTEEHRIHSKTIATQFLKIGTGSEEPVETRVLQYYKPLLVSVLYLNIS